MLSAWPGGLVRGQAPLEVRELTCQEGREIAFLHTDTLHTRCSGPAHWGGATHGLESSGRSQGLEKGPAALV